MANEYQKQNVFRKLLDNEVTRVVGIISIVFLVYSMVFTPIGDNEKRLDILDQTLAQAQETSKEITNLKDNHIHSIEQDVDDIDKRLSNLETELAAVRALLEAQAGIKTR